MTPELQQRLERSLPPFDGACIHNIDTLSLSQLREFLGAATSLLSGDYPELRSFHDWHEHDGYIVEPQHHSWDSLHSAIATNRLLFESRDDDWDVRIAIFPPSFEWLLRYNIDTMGDTDYNTAACDFDFTVADGASSTIAMETLFQRSPTLVTKCESRQWFASNYGG